ncbi:hypothetical protein [Mangrovimonas sp. YM274]|uniref:hypothetical protein n=1 Tax=Mangrovimonas sp. YM274 TaxID=3070660 RepID=UPI0027DDD884|nr:hypothetical protein [Mangrovimonas sp. YM274]WMI67187.1 hypothetical protein RBH95_08520 [Mangrovimonas sp. YM274]
MTLELIVFIASILFGLLIYWRESNGNGLYRSFNKIINSKKLQMKAEDKTGFVYQQSFLIRLVSITFLFLIGIVIAQFLLPIDLAAISLFASMILGTIIGTYLAQLIFKSNEVIDEQSESLEGIVQETLEKGKDFIDDFKQKNLDKEAPKEELSKEAPPTDKEQKSARERLKDKGLL